MYRARTTISFSVLALGLALPCLAQEELLEKFLPLEHETDEAEESWLQSLLDQPLDLNRVQPEELQRLPFLSSGQIQSFLAQRKAQIYFAHLEDALLALEVHGDTLALCRDLFKVLPPEFRLTKNRQAHTRVRGGVPATREANWLGPQYRTYQRVSMELGALQLGALVERDPGEARWNDHHVWVIMLRLRRGHVLLGNYQNEWGLGLVQWGPYAATASSAAHNLSRKGGRGLTPFLSTNENFSYRGAALTHTFGRATFAVFLSSNTRDVTLNHDSHAVNYRTSGLHRTTSENAQRDNLREQTYGADLRFRFGEGRRLGVLYFSERFNRFWQGADQRESHFDFSGAHNYALSLAGAWQTRQHNFAFEMAQSRDNGRAAAFMMAREERAYMWSVAFFHADRDFHSMHGRGFTESDAPLQGANGYSMNLSLQLPARLRAEFFYQQEKRLWSTNETPLPPHKQRSGAQLEWQTRQDLSMLVRYHFLCNENEEKFDRLRYAVEHKLFPKVRLKPRFDLIRARPKIFSSVAKSATGTALAVDLLWQPHTRFTLSFRETHFDTPFPLYQYERDLPGVFTVAALRERGRRRYIYGHLKLNYSFSLAGKISFAASPRSTPNEGRAWGVQLDWVLR